MYVPIGLMYGIGHLKVFISELWYLYFLKYVQDENGIKTVNEYVREYKIGSGSYGKVVSIGSI